MRLVNIGYGNMVAVNRLIAIVSPDAAPIRRLVQDARDAGHVVDATCGHRTRAVIIMARTSTRANSFFIMCISLSFFGPSVRRAVSGLYFIGKSMKESTLGKLPFVFLLFFCFLGESRARRLFRCGIRKPSCRS